MKDEEELMLEAEAKAAKKKHKMGAWYFPRVGIARSECEICRAGITIFSDEGNHMVLGGANVNRCLGFFYSGGQKRRRKNKILAITDGSKPRVLGAATVNRCIGHTIYSAGFFNERIKNVTDKKERSEVGRTSAQQAIR